MVIPMEYLKRAQHPKLLKRLALAEIIYIIIAFLFCIEILYFKNYYVIAFLIVLFFVGLVSFLLIKSKLRANSLRVTRDNFPEIFQTYCEVKILLGYEKEVSIYIIEEGTINASVIKFISDQVLVLNSELVKDMRNENILQIRWIIARFIGGLKAKHFSGEFQDLIIESIENLKLFNFFLLPYKRAVQYTGDNIGLLVCDGNVEEIFIALNKFLIGNDLAKEVNLTGVLIQAKEIQGDIFATLSRVTSTHPHLIDRYLSLLSFCKVAYPNEFEKIVKKYCNPEISNIEPLLIKYQ